VPLRQLFSKRTGQVSLDSRQAVADKYCFASGAQLLITGASRDQPIEDYWSKARAKDFAHAVLALQPDLITTPNFSAFSNVPRWDNLYNMKRIAICWSELASAGTPTALHVNARTDQDYARWAEFLQSHTEIEALSFEFQTGTASPRRARWHVERLVRLAREVDRAMTLVALGGWQYLSPLGAAFSRVVHVTANPLQKALHRQILSAEHGRSTKYERVLTLEGQAIDGLLQQNCDQLVRMLDEEPRTSPIHNDKRSREARQGETATSLSAGRALARQAAPQARVAVPCSAISEKEQPSA
jgi:hypothetical protein